MIIASRMYVYKTTGCVGSKLASITFLGKVYAFYDDHDWPHPEYKYEEGS